MESFRSRLFSPSYGGSKSVERKQRKRASTKDRVLADVFLRLVRRTGEEPSRSECDGWGNGLWVSQYDSARFEESAAVSKSSIVQLIQDGECCGCG